MVIINMDMPKSCENCNHWSFDHTDEPRCDITYSYISRFDKRLNDCPLRSADKMIEEIKEVDPVLPSVAKQVKEEILSIIYKNIGE